MARSRAARPKRKTSRLIIAIPIIALAVIAAVYVADVYPASPASPAAMDFTDQIYVTIASTTHVNQTSVVHPSYSIGEPGGSWGTHQYDANGVGYNYPLYMDDPSIACPNANSACTFHVRSKVVHAYTLGDFMAIWGHPFVQQGNTYVVSNFPVNSDSSHAWQVCIGATPSQATVDTLWGGLVLQPKMAVTITWYDTANGFGCAAS